MDDGETEADQIRGRESEVAESLLIRIVRRVAGGSDRDELDLEPLGWTLDVDALDSLVTTSRSPHLRVSFRYEGCVVEIDGGGMVRVTKESKQRG